MKRERLLLAVPPLLGWYRISKRDLPWRKDRTPYSVLVSELMLQQTRVEAVKERYVRFLTRFPTAEALAAATEEEVLKEWEGLGYYSRARNLHRAAKIIVREGFPQTWVGVRALPGVGDYTAGAISSLALGVYAPAVDGNVLRILTRLLADPAKIDENRTKRDFSALLTEVCPACGACPWSALCLAHLEGREEDFPVRGEKRPRRVEEHDVYIMTCGGKYALVRREEGLLKGLYGFPFLTAPPAGRELAARRAKHIFTHVEWHMTGHLVEVEGEDPAYLWATAEEIEGKYPLPSAFSAFRIWIKGA